MGQVHQRTASALPEWGRVIPISGYREDEARGNTDYVYRWIALRRGLSRMVVGPGQLVRDELRAFRYLGPLREMPRRDYRAPRHCEDSHWAKGLAAWDALCQADERIIEPQSESRENEPAVAETAEKRWGADGSQAVAQGEEVGRLSIKEVNEWLGNDHLKAGYAVRVRSLIEVKKQTIPEGNAPVELAQFVEQLRKCDTTKQVALLPEGQSIEVQPHDVGTGISQLLPVVVLALDARRNLVAIEQPELHLHPKLQAELGDLFVESALGKGNRLLIETHSEHLILRIMRRMRDTVRERRGDAPRVRPEDVAVLFVNPAPRGSSVHQLRLKPDGTLLDPWPGGFFEEGFAELFG
jgi:hypothetical protein